MFILQMLKWTMPGVLGRRLVRILFMLTRTSRYGDITVRCPRYNRDTEGGKSFLLQPQNYGTLYLQERIKPLSCYLLI